MTSRIWIVTTGSHSDYRIQGAYAAEAEALEHALTIEEKEGYRAETGIEVYDGPERIWDEEPQRRTLYRIEYSISKARPETKAIENVIYGHEMRAKVERYGQHGFTVVGTDLDEAKKVFSDTLTADMIRQAQGIIDQL